MTNLSLYKPLLPSNETMVNIYSLYKHKKDTVSGILTLDTDEMEKVDDRI
jgi:hypothetical protein